MGAVNYISQLITKSKKHIQNNIITVGNFKTSLTEMDKSSKQKINKEIKALNDTLDQMDITDIFRTFHPKATKYIFFSSTHGTFSRIDHFLVTNQVSTSTKRLGSFSAYLQTTVL